jgi:tripartite-type tricarboxylate transporter receptor subunit TctC
VKFNTIPYNGTAQQKTALGSHTLDIGFLAASEVADPDNEATPLRLLAQFSKAKVQRLSSVPTTYELGLPVEMTAERGFAAPNGVPAPILARLGKAIEAAMKDPDYLKAARNDAPFLSFLGGAEWTRQIEQESRTYEPIARALPKE